MEVGEGVEQGQFLQFQPFLDVPEGKAFANRDHVNEALFLCWVDYEIKHISVLLQIMSSSQCLLYQIQLYHLSIQSRLNHECVQMMSTDR